jgi:hypothetical protein
MILTQFIFDVSPVVARAYAQRGYVPAQISQARSYKAIRQRLGYEGAPLRLAAPAPASVAPAPLPRDEPKGVLRDIKRIYGWGKPEPGSRIIRKLRSYREDLLDRIVAGAPEREREPITPPAHRSHAFRASLRIRAREIVCETAAAYGLTFDDLIARLRVKEVTFAREEAMYRIKRELTLSFVDVAKVMHRDDHTTIRSGIAYHAARVEAIKATIKARV